MKTKFILLFLFIVSAISIFLIIKNRSNKNSINNDTLIVGTSADYPPYAFLNIKTNEIVGFDIDIINEVAKRLNKKIIIKDLPFTSLILGLLSENIDVIAAGMSPTEKRKQTVEFSKLYTAPDKFVIITKKSNDSINNLDDLKNRSVCTNTGYTADLYLSSKNIPGINIVKLTTPAESIMALNNNAVEAFVSAQNVAMTILQNKKNFSDDFKINTINDIAGDGCALAINKNNKKLLEQINLTLDSMINDGTINKLKNKWHMQ